MATIIGIQHVVAVNHQLQTNGLPAKVHLHDACGGQTLTLELFSAVTPAAEKNEDLLTRTQDAIRSYFSEHGITVAFDMLTGTTFRAI